MSKILGLMEEGMLIPGIPGYEGDVSSWMKEKLTGCTDKVYTDQAGNVIGVIEGTEPKAYKTMLMAHMDQIGMVVTNITEKGFLKVTKNGSVPDKVLPGCELIIRTVEGQYIPAVVSVKSHHAMTDVDKSRVEPITDLFVDIGAINIEDACSAGVRIGCAVQYKPGFVRLRGNRIAGTTIDDRAGCAILISCAQYLFKRRPKTTVYFTATVQEEHNLRGGMIAAKAISPDIAICLDVTLASDLPGMEALLDNWMGSGPTINMYSFHGRGTLNGTIAHEGLAQLAQHSADHRGFHINRFAMRGILTDASYVQFEGQGGVASIDLGFPVNNIHSPREVCDMEDIEKLRIVTCDVIEAINADFQLRRF